MEKYVLIEKGIYQGQEARIIKEDGPWLELVVFGREQKVARSQVRFLPDNYKPFDGFKIVSGTIDGSKMAGITAEKINGVDFTTYPAHDVYRGPMKGLSASSGVNPIGVIMDNLSSAVNNILNKAKAPKDSGALGNTPPPLNNALYSRDEIPEAITKEKIDKFLEEWPDQDFDICPPVIDPEVEALRMEQEATIKALRLRSRSKGKTNESLSLKNDQLQKEIKEVNRDMDAVLKDNSGLKEKNEFLRVSLQATEETAATYKKRYKSEKQAKFDYINEVEKGNNYRQGLKETIEALHEQIRERDDQAAAEETKTNKLADDLARANRIIDKLTEPGR